MLVGEGPDSVRWYLTGAAADGRYQGSAAASLGYGRSSLLAESLGVMRDNSIRGVRIDFVSGSNGPGLGLLTLDTTGFSWTPPGGAAGDAVDIAEGETRVVTGDPDDADERGKYLILTRTDDGQTSGNETVQLLDVFNNVWGGSNFEDSTLPRVRAGMVRAGSAVTGLTVWIAPKSAGPVLSSVLGASGAGTIGTAGTFAGWRERGLCEIRTSGGALREVVYYESRTDLALTVAAGGRGRLGTSAGAGNVSDVVYDVSWASVSGEAPSGGLLTDKRALGEESVPGLTFLPRATTGAGVSIGNLGVDEMYGLWVERWPSDYATHVEAMELRYSFTAGGIAYWGSLRGLWRVAQTAVEGMEIWLGVDAAPDTTVAPDYVETASPLEIEDLELGHDYYVTVLPRNKWGVILEDDGLSTVVVTVTADGDELGAAPSGPELVSIVPQAEGKATIYAVYYPGHEGGTAGAVFANRARWWLTYLRVDGTDPDPDIDEAVVTAMMGGEEASVERLRGAVETSYLEDQPIRVLMRTRQVDVVGEGEEAENVNRDSTNTDIHGLLAQWFSGGSVEPRGHLGRAWTLGREAGIDERTVYVDEAKNVRFVLRNGVTEFWADTVLIWAIHWTGEDAGAGLFTTFAINQGTVDEVATAEAAIEIGTWTEIEKTIYVNVRDKRRMVIDVLNGRIAVSRLSQLETISGTLSDAPAWRKWAHTCFQVWRTNGAGYGTAVEVQYGDGTLVLGVPWKRKATQGECL